MKNPAIFITASMALISSIILAAASLCRADAGPLVSFADSPGGFRLVRDGKAADIVYDPSDFKAVSIAAEALAGDIVLVTGVKPAVKKSAEAPAGGAVIIGTLEKCALIKKLAAEKKLDASAVEGKWETFLITVVEKPFPGVDSALVVAGSDRRGAAFGAFEISRAAGVSPWVWWADMAPEKREALIVPAGARVFGPPSVKYRGIFLNDEDFGLKPWAAKTFEPETGDIGPKTYARIFELLLRLRANHIWPAMHKCTHAFNHYDANKFVADDYAIVMGSSHCEQMLRNNVDEWDYGVYGEWTYLGNRDGLLRYWEERVKANGKFENVYTLGMRAIHDSGMPDGKTTEEKARILDSIIKDQRGMIARNVNPAPEKVPQVFIPYKEVLDIYRAGLDVPGDVTLMWPDDNFGYIRRLPSAEERARPGGNGVYYHISYWGPPHDYLWLCTTPPALLWEEMSKAWTLGAQTLWILNVGDIKPGEIGTELFLDMAWDISRWNRENISGFLADWAARTFGPALAADTADVLSQWYTLNYPRKPEHMGFYDKYSIMAKNQDPEFSLPNYGDEVSSRIAAFDTLERRAEEIYGKLPAAEKDAFFQIVLYPVRASSLMNKKQLYAYKSRRYARQKRASAAAYAEESKSAAAALKELTRRYNEDIAGGKWKLMMSDNPNNLPVFKEVETATAKLTDEPGLGVAVEGLNYPVPPDEAATASPRTEHPALPAFNRFTAKKYFFDVYNTGKKPLEWKATPSAPWIKLDKTSGSLGGEERILVDVDYATAPRGESVSGTVTVSGAGASHTFSVNVFNPGNADTGGARFVQDNGVIAINAASLTGARDASGAGWRVIPGLGRTGSALGIFPPSMPGIADVKDATASAPVAEYTVFVFETGEGDPEVILEAVPTHETARDGKLRAGVSVDGGEIVPVNFVQAGEESVEIGKINVFRNMMNGEAKLPISLGFHTIKIWGLDPSVILDRIIINFGGLKKSYLGPAETRATE